MLYGNLGDTNINRFHVFKVLGGQQTIVMSAARIILPNDVTVAQNPVKLNSNSDSILAVEAMHYGQRMQIDHSFKLEWRPASMNMTMYSKTD